MNQKFIFIVTFLYLSCIQCAFAQSEPISTTQKQLLYGDNHSSSDQLDIRKHKKKRGRRGPQGNPGPIGPRGEMGPPGSAGEQGLTGPAEAPGAKWDTGNTGPAGAKGDKGDTGNTGTAGTPGTPGTPGVKGDKGDTGATGSITENAVSYYGANASSAPSISPGQTTTISFANPNTRLGSNILVNGSTITMLTNGTYLLSISGIVQEQQIETESSSCSFSIGLQEEEEGEHPFSNTQPYPLAEYNQTSSYEGFILTQTFNVLQMVKVSYAPVVFNVLLNNNSGLGVTVINPVLNIIQLD